MIKYNQLDKHITKSMLHVENQVGHQKSYKYEWSLALKLAVQVYRYRSLWLKNCKYPNQHRSFAQYSREGNITESLHNTTLMEDEMVAQLQSASQTLKDQQKDNTILRESYLNSLAEAIVVHQSLSLLHNTATHQCSE